jgi:hypothetical protein
MFGVTSALLASRKAKGEHRFIFSSNPEEALIHYALE